MDSLHSSGFALKPCPFCGSSPTMHVWFGQWMINCTSEVCPAQPNVKSATKAIAAQLWNARMETKEQKPPNPKPLPQEWLGHAYTDARNVEIYRDWLNGKKCKDLAAQYRLTVSRIHYIIRTKRWNDSRAPGKQES